MTGWPSDFRARATLTPLPPGRRSERVGAVARAELEVGHAHRAVEGGVEGDGDDHGTSDSTPARTRSQMLGEPGALGGDQVAPADDVRRPGGRSPAERLPGRDRGAHLGGRHQGWRTGAVDAAAARSSARMRPGRAPCARGAPPPARARASRRRRDGRAGVPGEAPVEQAPASPRRARPGWGRRSARRRAAPRAHGRRACATRAKPAPSVMPVLTPSASGSMSAARSPTRRTARPPPRPRDAARRRDGPYAGRTDRASRRRQLHEVARARVVPGGVEPVGVGEVRVGEARARGRGRSSCCTKACLAARDAPRPGSPRRRCRSAPAGRSAGRAR